MLDINTIITSGVLLTAAGLIGYAIKDLPIKAYKWVEKRMVYSVTIYQNDELFDVVEEWLFAHYNQHYRDVEATLGQTSQVPEVNFSSRPPAKELRYKQEENFFVANIDGKNIFISKSKEKIDKAQSLRDIYYRKYLIRGFRAKNQINSFLEKIVSEYNLKLTKGILKVYTNNSWGEWLCVNDISVKAFNKVIIPKEQKDSIIEDLNAFVSSKDWYKERGIRHKRGYLFHGTPGNGKTTIAMAIAEYLNKDIYVLNLNSLENDGYLIRAFSMLSKNIVLLIEDIDRAFSKRENVDSKVSFSTVLNSFDGALCRDGMITIITTNHIERLDDALIRDGRVDIRQEIVNPSNEQAKEYIESFYGIKVSVDIYTDGLPMSSIQEICIQNKDNSLSAINRLSSASKKLAVS